MLLLQMRMRMLMMTTEAAGGAYVGAESDRSEGAAANRRRKEIR